MLELQAKVLTTLSASPRTADEIAAAIGAADDAETVFLLLEHLAANGRAKSSCDRPGGREAFSAG